MSMCGHHGRRLITVSEDDSATGSRVGGRPPEGLVLACPTCSGPAEYVLTLGPDVLGPTVDDRALSLLACEDIACRFQGPEGGDCSTLVVDHPDTPRVGGEDPADGWPGRALLAGPETDTDPDPNSDQTKAGGEPGYLQPWGHEVGPEREAAGLRFIAQWSEVSYLPDMDGTYPFLFGTVYLFAGVDADGRIDLGSTRGFWQNA
jgi:hypothetical protein